MVCNKILRQGLPPLKNTNETMAWKLTRQCGMTTTQPQKLQTATTGPTTCKVEEKQTSDNHEEVQLQLQDLNFSKLNQTITRIMERTSEHVSTTEPLMSVENYSTQFHSKQHHQKNGTKLYCNASVQ
jgi:type II secretory pathway component PulM